jgi:hypothetical protein
LETEKIKRFLKKNRENTGHSIAKREDILWRVHVLFFNPPNMPLYVLFMACFKEG